MDADEFAALIERLRAQGTDDGLCEVKSAAGGLGVAVWDSISAFANTRGGLVVLGLTERAGFEPAKGFDLDRVLDQLVDGIGDGGGDGRLDHPPSYHVERHTIQQAPVLVIRVAENDTGSKPCFVRAKGLQGGSYKRVDDKNIRLSATEIFEMQQTLLRQDSDLRAVPQAGAEDLDDQLVQGLLNNRKDSKALRGVTTRQAQLVRLNVQGSDGEILLGGLLALGRYPQQFHPRLLIDVAVHPTTDKSAPGGRARFVDRALCDGPLAESIEEAVAAVARNLRTSSTVEGAARTDHLEIPREVLREAIANAVLHREYHDLFLGRCVGVDVFPDRVLVTSPGGLWGGKTLENLDDGTSECRNPVLMQLLQAVPFRNGPGLTVEGQGGGIKLMIHEMEAHALDRPTFRVTPAEVVVELRRHGVEVPELRTWLRSVTDEQLTGREDAALLIAKREGTVSVARLREDLRIDSDDARVLLDGLASSGLLHPDGFERYVLWSDVPRRRPAKERILEVLDAERPLRIQELAEILHREPASLRPLLRELVASGKVVATAAPTSRRRAYLRARDHR